MHNEEMFSKNLENVVSKFEELTITLNKIADELGRIAHSLESLDESGIKTFPNN